MIRPRWQRFNRSGPLLVWRRWDQAIALIAALNLAWVIFDLSYVALRSFWLQRNLYPLPSLPLVVPLPWLPAITPLYDPLKGIEPHRDTKAYLDHFQTLDREAMAQGIDAPAVRELLNKQTDLTIEMIETNPFLNSGNAGTLERLKNRLRTQAGLESSREAACLLYTSPSPRD